MVKDTTSVQELKKKNKLSEKEYTVTYSYIPQFVRKFLNIKKGTKIKWTKGDKPGTIIIEVKDE